MTRRSVARLPADRDLRMRRGLLALLIEGGARAASRASGIPYRSIARWAASAEGQRMLVDLRRELGEDLGREILATARLAHGQLRRAIEMGAIAPGQLAVTLGILVDKARALLPGEREGEPDDYVVQVRFGGVRAERRGEGGDVETREASGAEIVVRGPRRPAQEM